MATFTVRVWTTDWCGYEDTFVIEAESEDEAIALAEKELADTYDLIPVGDGEFAEMEDLDENLERTYDTEVTTISACLVGDDEE